MKICLIGDLSGNLDEGMKNITSHLTRELAQRHEVLNLSPRAAFYPGFWRKAKAFQPQIIHYIPGPSLQSFILAKALAKRQRKAKVVMSAFHPDISSVSKRFLPLFKPDMILIQSRQAEKMFSTLDCPLALLPIGVDTEKFHPVSAEAKGKLREKYGIAQEKFVVLHVGHLNKGRNLQVLEQLQGHDNQVLIVGSTSTKVDQELCHSLEQKGCLVWRNYFSNLEEVYALSDCYIFPTRDALHSIELPLSVMEAMACNLPVVSTRFGALPRFLSEGDGLFFVDKASDFRDRLQQLKSGIIGVKTREKVLSYSWERVAARLEEIYRQVINEDKDGE